CYFKRLSAACFTPSRLGGNFSFSNQLLAFAFLLYLPPLHLSPLNFCKFATFFLFALASSSLLFSLFCCASCRNFPGSFFLRKYFGLFLGFRLLYEATAAIGFVRSIFLLTCLGLSLICFSLRNCCCLARFFFRSLSLLVSCECFRVFVFGSRPRYPL